MAAQFMFIQCEFSSHFPVYHPWSLFHIAYNIQMSMKIALETALPVERLLHKHEVPSWIPIMHAKNLSGATYLNPGDEKVKRGGSAGQQSN